MGGLDEDGGAVGGHCSECSYFLHCLKDQKQVYCRDCGKFTLFSSLTNVKDTNIHQKLLQ
jgi:hypothetical protein